MAAAAAPGGAATGFGVSCNNPIQHHHRRFFNSCSHLSSSIFTSSVRVLFPHPPPSYSCVSWALPFCSLERNASVAAAASAAWMTSDLEEDDRQAFKLAQLWEELFSDPSQWWDYRGHKINSRSPDFKHKSAKKALWIDNRLNPPWMHARLAAMAQFQEQEKSPFSSPDITGRAARVEQLWQEFFADPSQWWDNRFIKKSPKFPDFKHKSTHEGLWMEARLNPLWVKAKMAALAFNEKLSGGELSFWAPDSILHKIDSVSELCQKGHLKEALHVAELMIKHNIRAPTIVYVNILKACTRIKALAVGKQVHALIIQSGLCSDNFLGKLLVEMYAVCGSLSDARKVFNKMPKHNVFVWTAMISAYANHGKNEEAITLFHQMQQTGVAPDVVAFVVLLKACGSMTNLEQGKKLHSDIIHSGFESNIVVGNALVDMYAKCGCIEQARQVFNKMSELDMVSWTTMITGYFKCACIGDARKLFSNMNKRDVVAWTAMIEGYAQNGLCKEALALYEEMKQEAVKPNNVTYVTVLKVCGSIAALEEGKKIHSHITESGLQSDVSVDSALVDMYAKSGCIELARQVFDKMSTRDVVSWTSIITGYAQQGLGEEALILLEQMQREGIMLNEVTFVSVLSACSHSGLVKEGCHLFDAMSRDYGITPTMKHYACMVDLLGRAGCLVDADDFIHKMPIQPDAVVWMALLGAARNHGHVEIGRRAFDSVMNLEPENSAAYVLLSNIYAAAGRTDELAMIRKES